MGIFDKLRGRPKAPALLEDIPKAEAWLAENMEASGYRLDGSLESFRELDRFFDEQSRPGGLLADGRPGSKLFAVGAYMGQVFVRELGGAWETDDGDPYGEINIAVRLPGGALVWPVQRAMKRLRDGPEEGFYAYGLLAAGVRQRDHEHQTR